jgi:hypothetical protein
MIIPVMVTPSSRIGSIFIVDTLLHFGKNWLSFLALAMVVSDQVAQVRQGPASMGRVMAASARGRSVLRK